MGKKDGTSSSSSSWLTAVKRAFRSPNKDSDKKSSRRKVDHQHQEADEDDKKRERRRWLFRRQSKNTEVSNHEVKECKKSEVSIAPKSTTSQHAIEVAAATAAAAEAAVATAKAAVEIIRLTHPSINAASSASAAVNLKQHSAATVIQTAFRGYLARSALIALKGIVKLQALIRGQIVRRQANMTMKCMKALLRVQSRVRDQRARLSHDVGRRSMFAESTNLWESKYLKDIRARNSRSREGSYVSDDWGECPRTLQELEAIIKARNEAALTHERSLAFAFQQQNQIMDSDRVVPYERDVKELEEVDPTSFLDQWMPSKPWEDNNTGRASADTKREPIKTVEIDSQKPINNNGRRSRAQSPIHTRSQHHINNNHRSSFHNEARMIQSPITPSFASRTRPSQVRSASPRCLKEDRSSHSAANTPSLRMQRAGPRYSTSANNHNYSNNNNDGILPNYMAATESAKARIRSQSAPRQRPCTPDRERGGSGSSTSVKKRLSYPIPEPYCVNFGFGFDGHGRDLRSSSFKSVQAGYVGMAEESTYYAESVVGGEISPCSTTDLRRWLR